MSDNPFFCNCGKNHFYGETWETTSKCIKEKIERDDY